MKSTPRRGSSLHNNNKSLETAKRNLLNASIQNNSTTESPQFITEEKPLTPVSENGLMRRDSLNESDDDEEDDPFFDFHTVSMDAEEVYTEALMDELKKLQVNSPFVSILVQGGHKPGKHGKPGKLRELEKLSKSQGKLREFGFFVEKNLEMEN